MSHSRSGAANSYRDTARAVELARLVERGLRQDLRRLHAEMVEEESRLTALEEIRWHSMQDFEAMSEQGVTTVEAALYYTLFHHLTQEITLQGHLVVTAQHRVRDKRAAVQAALEDLLEAQRSDGRRRTRAVRSGKGRQKPWRATPSGLKKAS